MHLFFHRFRRVLLSVCLYRFLLLLCPMRTSWFCGAWPRDFNAWSFSINDPQRIAAARAPREGVLEPLPGFVQVAACPPKIGEAAHQA